jgi:hypothetical protein
MRFNASILVLLAAFSANSYAGGELKKVCHEEKGKQVCKTVKVHKKLSLPLNLQLSWRTRSLMHNAHLFH